MSFLFIKVVLLKRYRLAYTQQKIDREVITKEILMMCFSVRAEGMYMIFLKLFFTARIHAHSLFTGPYTKFNYLLSCN